MKNLSRTLLMAFAGLANTAAAGELARMGTEQYPHNTPTLQPVLVMAPLYHYGPAMPPPVMVQPMVIPVIQPVYYPAGYLGLVAAPVYVNYRLWTP